MTYVSDDARLLGRKGLRRRPEREDVDSYKDW